MISERKALYRQLQHYFETGLFGLYRWGDVQHQEPEPVTIERDPIKGRRINQRSLGRFVEKAVIRFDGYTLVLWSPNEIEQTGSLAKPAVELYDGPAMPDNLVVQGANSSETWAKVTQLLRDNIARGKSDERQERSAGW